MNATWHLIQYTADIRRKEPRNVGVAVTVDGECAVKFLGVENGRVDGRQLRSFGLSHDAYADWVDYYTTMLCDHLDVERVLNTQRRRPAEFRLILAGHTTSGEPAGHLVEKLYRDLVSNTDSASASEAWSRVLKQRVDSALAHAQVQTATDVEVGANWGDAADLVKFHYRAAGDRPALMDRLQLHHVNDERAKAVAREFNARVTAARQAGAPDLFIAFYSGQAIEQVASPTVLAPIRGVANVINVDNEDDAVEAIHRYLAVA